MATQAAYRPAATTTTTVGMTPAWQDADRGSILRVRSVSCLATGSSFVVRGGPPALLVTNRHVAAGSSDLQLSSWDGHDLIASVKSISGGPDLALLSTDSATGGGLPVATADPAQGTWIYVAGYPKGGMLDYSPGTVIDYVSGAPFDLPGRLMRVNAPVEPGNSGGPVLDANGNVVGVLFASETATNYGLVIPVSALSAYMAAPDANSRMDCVE